ncbi:MAG: adenylosuccinate synthetase, partial [Flavisolibacter sp.]|nr:adenylosuccinate synthetase [Flavisolibacter sp.]
ERLFICTSYKLDGTETTQIPFLLTRNALEPCYQQFRGWQSDISQISDADGLPAPMKEYIQFINKNLQVPVRFISNGPSRNQIIKIEG